MHNELLLLSRNRDSVAAWQSGVSLHGHTRHSQESLGFIASFMEKRPQTRRWLEGKKRALLRNTGVTLDLERAYWTPPLCERQAHLLEERQIGALGLRPMISLTDHNSIDAGLLLREEGAFREAPISTEWTVPFGEAVFHFGVHNLPAAAAREWMKAMHDATASADETQVVALFRELCRMREVLVIFNHPLWNLYGMPAERFHYELRRFLQTASEYVHAFELNGMRGHAENRGVIRLAAEWDQLLISGGDRHGCEPNAWLNLTNAADFPEFVEEIRAGRQSTVLIMPQYGVPLGWRFYQNFTHVIAEYPGHPEGRRFWDQRVFHPDQNGIIAPMFHLGGRPEFLARIFGVAMMASRLPVGSVLRHLHGGANESLRLHGERRAGDGRPGAGETIPESGLEDCLYRSGEPAAD